MPDSALWSYVRHKPGKEVSGEQPCREGSGSAGSQETKQESEEEDAQLFFLVPSARTHENG